MEDFAAGVDFDGGGEVDDDCETEDDYGEPVGGDEEAGVGVADVGAELGEPGAVEVGYGDGGDAFRDGDPVVEV